jgi:hypothetical protein
MTLANLSILETGKARANPRGAGSFCGDNRRMLWFYKREEETLQAETRVDNTTGAFLLIIRWPDGRSATERFDTLAAFQTRLDRLQRELVQERWVQSGPPEILPDGWPTGDGTEPVH